MTDRFVVIRGYILDKYILGGVLQLIFFGTLFGLFWGVTHGISFNHFECIRGSMEHPLLCENPFYKPATWENQAMLPVGVYGYIPWPVRHVWILFLGLTFIAVLLNHFIHNGGFEFDKIIDIKSNK